MQHVDDALLRECRLPLCGRRLVIKLRKLGEGAPPSPGSAQNEWEMYETVLGQNIVVIRCNFKYSVLDYGGRGWLGIC